MFDRFLRVVGRENYVKMQQTHVLLIGVGGVGGYALEALVRSGIGFITILDFDTIELTNLNRQIITTQQNIGLLKAEEAKKRAESINSECQVSVITKRLLEDEITVDFLSSYDYILDACDDTKVKEKLIQVCFDHHIPLISCMGTGNRIQPQMLEITTLKKTVNDPLAKRIRNELRKINEKYLNTPVVWSRELPIRDGEGLGTVCPVPMAAGSLLASFVIQEILKNEIL